jgi:hypothetical protein
MTSLSALPRERAAPAGGNWWPGSHIGNNPGMKRLLLTVLIALAIWLVLIMAARLLGYG